MNKINKLIVIFLILLGIFSFNFFSKARKIYPNIILISIDALRFDHLGCYGYKRPTSPNIDKLAQQGILFTQVIAQASITGGSIPSLLSSTYPSTNGHYIFVEDPAVLTVSTLPLILNKYGYVTAAISAHGEIFNSIPGLDRGFDLISDTKDTPANMITKRALKWLHENKNNTFFIWVHYFDTHAPYQPPAPYDKLFITDEFNLSEISGFRREFAKTGIISLNTRKNMGKKEVDYGISQYDGALRFVDDQIGVMLGDLKSSGLLKNSVVIITSDHGENLYDRNQKFGHGSTVYDELLRVPLIFSGENRLPKKKIFNQPVQLIDIMPTILDMARINIGTKFEGRSLLPFILNKRVGLDYPVFSEALVGDKLLNSIRLRNWKLIEFSAPGKRDYELYYLRVDPQELNNLIGIEKAQLSILKRQLEKWQRREKLNNLAAKSRPLEDSSKINLRNLGYLQ